MKRSPTGRLPSQPEMQTIVRRWVERDALPVAVAFTEIEKRILAQFTYQDGLRAAAGEIAALHRATAGGNAPRDREQQRACKRLLVRVNRLLVEVGAEPVSI